MDVTVVTHGGGSDLGEWVTTSRLMIDLFDAGHDPGRWLAAAAWHDGRFAEPLAVWRELVG
jgi:hypothetical protein